jgi:nitric-oxide synthase, bacterial
VNQLEMKAASFIKQCYEELEDYEKGQRRMKEIYWEISVSGTYEHTYEELAYGAKTAWRNSNKCVGRLFWESLHVFDARQTKTFEEMADAARRHLQFAWNNGKIRSAVTIFPQRTVDGEDPFRFLNHQLVRYAGYESGVGDPDSLELTKTAETLGWEGEGTDFDVLPLMVKNSRGEVSLFELDKIEDVQEIVFTHPEIEAFSSLGLKWYAIPVISDMELEIGGIIYGAAPFNGWYMGTEIGARNLADPFRYNKLKETAEVFGLDTQKAAGLWKDRALVELNRAVLHSFSEAGVSIVDHHTAAEQFRIFCEKENRSGREVTGEWTWLIPPLSPASVSIFHNEYDNTVKTPNFFYRNRKTGGCPFHASTGTGKASLI